MNIQKSSGNKSETSKVLSVMRHLHRILNTRPKVEQSSASDTSAIAEPPEPNCDGADANLDAAMAVLRDAQAGVRHALRESIFCHSGGTILALTTEQDAALDLVLELVAFAIT